MSTMHESTNTPTEIVGQEALAFSDGVAAFDAELYKIAESLFEKARQGAIRNNHHSTPAIEWYRAKTKEAVGKPEEAKQAYEEVLTLVKNFYPELTDFKMQSEESLDKLHEDKSERLVG